MRVLLVSDFLPPVRGGLEFHVDALATELGNQGDEVHVATLTTNPQVSDPRVTVHTVRAASSRVLPHEDASRPFHPPLPDPLARRDFARLLDEVRPDVVHGHSWLTVSLPTSRPPLVYTAHDYGLACQIRTMVRPDGSVCSGPGPLKCIACGSHTYSPPVSALLAPGTARGRDLLRPDEVVAVSQSVAETLAPHLGRTPLVVHNFVAAVADAEPVPAGVLPEGRYAMFAGDPGAHKGLRDLLSVWQSDTAPDADLLVATTRVTDVPQLPRVRATSFTRGQVATAWERAHVAVVPSRWPDPCPTVVLEALRSGVPVVAYGMGGIPELVRDGVDGFIVPMGDVAALGEAIGRVVADPDLRERLSRNATARAQEFTAGPVVARLRQVYGSVVRGSAGAALVGGPAMAPRGGRSQALAR